MQHGAFIIGVSSCNEEVCAAAGRISTQQGSALEIFDRSHDAEKNQKLIGKVTASGHTSTVEHVFFNLAFENVSVVVEQFMIEFRLASFTVKSRRYVDFSDCGYFVPAFRDPANEAVFRQQMDKLFGVYTALCAADVPKEDARFVLPYCFYSNFFCSLGGRELLHVLDEMLYGRGKDFAEIHDIGVSLLKQCREAAPGVFADFEQKHETRRTAPPCPAVAVPDGTDGPRPAVELLAGSPDAQMTVAESALIEATGAPTDAVRAALNDEATLRRALDYAVHCDRPRALESAVFTLRFNDVSLAAVTHFVRHRIQSICVPSLTACDRGSYIIPAAVRGNEALLDLYVGAFEGTAALYRTLKASGETEETLVYVLLAGNVMDLVTTMNARELRLFLKLRTCTRAQWEIRAFAIEALRLLRERCPLLFADYGPSCVCEGRCPEGRMSCGRMQEMRERFGK
ncbi:MAG: FAD-dependent thymidylate synthase [Clostridia bacterium]|nr:FAD-dependent thymidylate synthase [Clostridia bacterium]